MSKTECNQTSFAFHPLCRRKVVARFDGGTITSDGGGLLLRETERPTGIVRQFAGCFTNHRDPDLIEHAAEQFKQTRQQYAERGEPARVFKDFTYQTLDSWSRSRRVVGKAEHLAKGANPRFVVTSLSAAAFNAPSLYEEAYCARGDMENRIKEQQFCLFADRTSAATMRANQLRLWLSSVAYTLLLALRRLGLRGTTLARARCDTIRLKLLKIGAQIRVTVRKVWVLLSESCPYRSIFQQVYDHLRRQRTIVLQC